MISISRGDLSSIAGADVLPKATSVPRGIKPSAVSMRASTSSSEPSASMCTRLAPCCAYQLITGAVWSRYTCEALAHGLGLVVLAAHERAALAVGRRTVSPGCTAEERALAHVARGAAAQAAHQLLFVDVEEQHGVDARAELGQHVVEPVGLRRRAHDAVEDRAVGGAGGDASASFMMPMMTASGTRSPRSMAALASRPSGVPSRTAARSTSPVAILGTSRRAASRSPCVPLPAPGGPSRTMIMPESYLKPIGVRSPASPGVRGNGRAPSS